MTNDILKRLIILVVVVLLQVLVLNHIHLFGCATPFLYLILPLGFNTGQKRWTALLWCFCIGLLVDIFANTPGVAAASMTLIGFIQPYLLPAFISHEEDDVFEPTLKELGFVKYLTYTFIITFIYCLAFFAIEAFTFFDVLLWIESVIGSTLLTGFVFFCLALINKK